MESDDKDKFLKGAIYQRNFDISPMKSAGVSGAGAPVSFVLQPDSSGFPAGQVGRPFYGW
jgi:hypothetical protein